MMDKNYNPLNPMVDQVQKFLDQKQVPKEQVVPFLMSLGYRGLAGAVAGRMRLDQASQGVKALQQAQGQSPAPPNVMQENDMKTQQLQQGIQQALGSRNPMMAQAAPNVRAAASGGIMRLAGGGPIAFQAGAIVPSVMQVNPQGQVLPPLEELLDAYEKSAGNPAEQSRIERLIKRVAPNLDLSSVSKFTKENLPTFSKYAERFGPTVTKYGTKLVKGAPVIGALGGLYGASQTDPESIQATSRLAQMGIMDVDPSSKTKTGLASLTGVAESMIPFAGLFYDTPLDRAQALTDKKVERIQKAPGVQTALSSDEAAVGQEYARIVREYGANSAEAKEFESRYRQVMGRSSPEDEDELARIMAQSAAGGAGTRPGAPRLPGVPTTARETKALTELRGRLAGMEDLSKPEAREAAIDREMAARMKRYTDMGILKPFDDAKANVQGRLKELEGIKDKNFYKAMAMMGFTMASTRGSFFQALAAGGAAGLSAYETFEDKRQNALDKLQDRMTNIDMSIASIKERAGAGAEARVDKLESDRKRVEDQITTLQSAQEQLSQTQAFQLALTDRQIAADAARDQTRFGGLDKVIEQDIVRYRAIADDPKQKASIREAARRKIEQLYKEREKATQGGSGSFQAAQLKALTSGIPGYNFPTVDSEQGGDDPYGVNALIAQYGQ